MKNLRDRLDRLEQVITGSSFFIRMQPDDTEEQARARFLIEHPNRKAALEEAGERVRFVRRVFVSMPSYPQGAA